MPFVDVITTTSRRLVVHTEKKRVASFIRFFSSLYPLCSILVKKITGRERWESSMTSIVRSNKNRKEERKKKRNNGNRGMEQRK